MVCTCCLVCVMVCTCCLVCVMVYTCCLVCVMVYTCCLVCVMVCTCCLVCVMVCTCCLVCVMVYTCCLVCVMVYTCVCHLCTCWFVSGLLIGKWLMVDMPSTSMVSINFIGALIHGAVVTEKVCLLCGILAWDTVH